MRERDEQGSATPGHEIISDVIEKHDIGLLTLNGTGKGIVPDVLRIEMTKLGSKYFQITEGPFLPTKNSLMNKSWFVRKLGDGQGEEVLYCLTNFYMTGTGKWQFGQ